MALHGTSEPRPLVTTQGYDGGGQFSPDGRWMAYVSNEEGPVQGLRAPLSRSRAENPVSTQAGTHLKWNPNGKELFYRSGNKMMAVEVSTRPGRHCPFTTPRALRTALRLRRCADVANYDVSPDGQRFVMVKDDSASGRLNVVLNWKEELKRLCRRREIGRRLQLAKPHEQHVLPAETRGGWQVVRPWTAELMMSADSLGLTRRAHGKDYSSLVAHRRGVRLNRRQLATSALHRSSRVECLGGRPTRRIIADYWPDFRFRHSTRKGPPQSKSRCVCGTVCSHR